MRIATLEARVLDAGFERQKLQQVRIAGPLSCWPTYAIRRSSWMWPAEKVVVRAVDTDGTVGWSVTNGGAIVATIINEHLRRFCVDRRELDIEEASELMVRSLMPADRSGFAMMAVAGIDIALWDVRTKQSGRALADLLGAGEVPSLPAYVTVADPDETELSGFFGVKVAMRWGPEGGREGVEENVDLLRKAQARAGSGARIMLDAFLAWDVAYTLRMAEASERAGVRLTWIEDPLLPSDLDGYRTIVERSGGAVKLALGNYCFHRWDCEPLLREGIASFLQPDVAWAGGVTECLRIAAAAKAHGCPVVLHNTAEQPWAVALAAALDPQSWVEVVDRGVDSRLTELLANTPRVAGGRLLVDKGLGNEPGPMLGSMTGT